MKKFAIRLPLKPVPSRIIISFEKALLKEHLTIESRGTLKTIPACCHWHITKTGLKGTLEATFDTNNKRFWLCYRDNRYAGWMEKSIFELKRTLAVQFKTGK